MLVVAGDDRRGRGAGLRRSIRHTRRAGARSSSSSLAAAVAQLFVARTPRGAARYYTTIVFLIAGVLLLPVGLVALIAVIQHVPEWLKMRYPWYIQTFNILNYTLNCLAAWFAAHLVLTARPLARARSAGRVAGVVGERRLRRDEPRSARGDDALRRAHAVSERASSSRSRASRPISILAALGVALATLWLTNRWLILAAVAPLILIHRSLNVPALEEEARVDPKTGLFNARHFAAELREELARAERFDRPMSVIMADLDLLRDINNAYGHLAGDAVLRGDRATSFRGELRDYDVPARFGGEEFAILLPETTPEQALEIAERIRAHGRGHARSRSRRRASRSARRSPAASPASRRTART